MLVHVQMITTPPPLDRLGLPVGVASHKIQCRYRCGHTTCRTLQPGTPPPPQCPTCGGAR